MDGRVTVFPEGEMSFEMLGQCDEVMSIKVRNDLSIKNGLIIQIEDVNGSKVIPVNGRTFQSAVNAVMEFLKS